MHEYLFLSSSTSQELVQNKLTPPQSTHLNHILHSQKQTARVRALRRRYLPRLPLNSAQCLIELLGIYCDTALVPLVAHCPGSDAVLPCCSRILLLVVFAWYGYNLWCSFGKSAIVETDLFPT